MPGQRSADKALSLLGCGYVYGATGWICTEARLAAQAKQYPDQAHNIEKYGPKWLGKRCYDCAQLTRIAALAAGVSLPSGSNSQWKSRIWAQAGAMDTFPSGTPGVHLFRRKDGIMIHTGISIGDGSAVEARGAAYGVQRRAVDAGNWTHWAIPSYGEEGEVPVGNKPTLRKGSTGTNVAQLQELLLEAGYSLPRYGADGSFGAETETAVKAFQKAHGLGVDGICGTMTWTALLAQEPAEKRLRAIVTGYQGGLLAQTHIDQLRNAGYDLETEEG